MKALYAFRDALSFLTILPVSSKKEREESPALRMSRALAWFPLVGALVGLIGGAVVYLTVSWLPVSVASLLGLFSMVILTGGLHLDGLADTVDGFGARGGREETLKVMRDSRIGTFGALGLFLVLGLKWALIQAIPTHQLIQTLAVTGSLGRWGLVLSGRFFPYAPGKEGLGRLVTDQPSSQSAFLATLLTLGLVLAGTSNWASLLLMGLAGGAVWVLNSIFKIRLGGITGDTLGALNEAVEVIALLFLARS